MINPNASHKNEENVSAMSVRAQPIIASGMLHVTAIFASGAKSDTCPN